MKIIIEGDSDAVLQGVAEKKGVASMICQECQKRPATVHLTRIVNNVKTEMHLCSECARSHQEFGFSMKNFGPSELDFPMNFEPSFPIHKFLAGLMNGSPFQTEMEPISSPQCPECGLSFARFGEIGKFGCSRCYRTFDDRLEPLIRRVQGSTRHTGKIPKRAGGRLGMVRESDEPKPMPDSEIYEGKGNKWREIERLKAQLQQAVKEEAYERAAELRDEIRDLEKKNE